MVNCQARERLQKRVQTMYLCLTEKNVYFNLNADKSSLLNKRSELLAKCRHAN